MVFRKLFYLISIFVLVSSLLLVLANNVPIFLSVRWLWGPILLIFSILFYSPVFLRKNVIAILLYGYLYSGILQYTLWRFANEWYKRAIREDFYALLIIGVMFTILKRYNFQREWRNLAKMGILIFVVTGIMTIVATSFNPMVVRASYSNLQFDMPEYKALFKMGFGGYGYMIAVVALIPILVYFYKTKNKFWLSNRIIIALIVFFLFILYRSQIFANFIVGIMALVLSLLGPKTVKRNFILISIIGGTILFIPSEVWLGGLSKLSNYFSENSLIKYKILDLIKYFEGQDMLNQSTGAGARAVRYPMLFKTFMENPFFGDASYRSNYTFELASGGHLYWMSRLTLWGIFGLWGYVIMLKKIFRPILNMFDREFKFYYMVSLLSIIILGMMKNLGGREPYIMLMIIIPGLYLSQSYFNDEI